MKYFSFLAVILFLSACNQQHGDTQMMQKRIDSLKIKLSETYKPGFGEFMSNIQIHHNKLWFAGQNENWKLADFEINEIKENLENIKKYYRQTRVKFNRYDGTTAAEPKQRNSEKK